MNLRRRLPALSGLLAFEAAARLSSFTRAGDELHVTQAAISRQIRLLEQQLGQRLFERAHRGVRLTSAGQQLWQAVGRGLGHIGEVADSLRHAQVQRLSIGATVAVGRYWLLPRLHQFAQQHPQLELQLLALDRELDPLRDGLDLWVACGEEQQLPAVQLEYLFPEQAFPVCSAEFLQRYPIMDVADLLNVPLLHLDARHWQNFAWPVVDWALWLKQQGLEPLLHNNGLSLNDYPTLIEAAAAGYGVALAWGPLYETQRLVRPVPQALPIPRAY